MRVLVAAILMLAFCLPTLAAGTVCAKSDPSFAKFLRQFGDDKQFQRLRTVQPLVARYGDYQMSNPDIRLLGTAELDALGYPLFRSAGELKKDGMRQSVLLYTKRYAEVVQDQTEADSDRVLFKFRSIEGCWFLEELHDKSL